VLGSIAAPAGAFSNEKVSVCAGSSGSVAFASKLYATNSGIVSSLGTPVRLGAIFTSVTVSVTCWSVLATPSLTRTVNA